MARKKVTLQWVVNNATRHAAYKRHYNNLIKKARDLTKLCNAKAAVVLYGEGETQPVVWPSILEAKKVFKKFKAMPEVGGLKNMQSQEDFLRGCISKLQNQVRKMDRENQEREILCLLLERFDGRRPNLNNITTEELNNLKLVVSTRMKKAKERLQQLEGGHGSLPK